jgi:hypothetical protein
MTIPETKTMDIWLVFVIVLMVLAIGGGLFMTGKTLGANIDELSIRTTGRLQRLETEVFSLRKQVQDIEFLLRKALEAKPAPAAPEAKPAPVVPEAKPAPAVLVPHK